MSDDRIGLEAELKGFAEDWILSLQKEVKTLEADQEKEYDLTREMRLCVIKGEQKAYRNMFLKVRAAYKHAREGGWRPKN
jgi:hypothetical protein